MLNSAANAALICLMLHACSATELTEDSSARTGTFILSGGDGNNNANNVAQSFLLLIPILGAILILDFAIFGTFATRADKLNPVSRFFYHAREGLAIMRNRRRKSGPQGYFANPQDTQTYQQYQQQPSAGNPEPYRVAR